MPPKPLLRMFAHMHTRPMLKKRIKRLGREISELDAERSAKVRDIEKGLRDAPSWESMRPPGNVMRLPMVPSQHVLDSAVRRTSLVRRIEALAEREEIYRQVLKKKSGH